MNLKQITFSLKLHLCLQLFAFNFLLLALGKVSMTELSGFMDSMKTFIPIVSGFILAFFAHDPQA
ncbi:MAG: hypothetical protein NTU44_04715 [Bacteroidetes bacterium]|nr:hypothetical protein [Bacteroidota bacterium]